MCEHCSNCCRYGKLAPAEKNYRMTDAQYKAEHGLVLQGDAPLPEALQTFESVGFPPDIMDEVLTVCHHLRSAAGLPPRRQHVLSKIAQQAAPPTCFTARMPPTARCCDELQAQHLVVAAAA
jgi:hypothetical protein